MFCCVIRYRHSIVCFIGRRIAFLVILDFGSFWKGFSEGFRLEAKSFPWPASEFDEFVILDLRYSHRSRNK